jgi:nitric oxide reductase large subunit
MNNNNGIDRRRFNYNLLIVMMLVIIFLMQLFNQKMLIHNADKLEHIETIVSGRTDL